MLNINKKGNAKNFKKSNGEQIWLVKVRGYLNGKTWDNWAWARPYEGSIKASYATNNEAETGGSNSALHTYNNSSNTKVTVTASISRTSSKEPSAKTGFLCSSTVSIDINSKIIAVPISTSLYYDDVLSVKVTLPQSSCLVFNGSDPNKGDSSSTFEHTITKDDFTNGYFTGTLATIKQIYKWNCDNYDLSNRNISQVLFHVKFNNTVTHYNVAVRGYVQESKTMYFDPTYHSVDGYIDGSPPGGKTANLAKWKDYSGSYVDYKRLHFAYNENNFPRCIGMNRYNGEVPTWQYFKWSYVCDALNWVAKGTKTKSGWGPWTTYSYSIDLVGYDAISGSFWPEGYTASVTIGGSTYNFSVQKPSYNSYNEKYDNAFGSWSASLNSTDVSTATVEIKTSSAGGSFLVDRVTVNFNKLPKLEIPSSFTEYDDNTYKVTNPNNVKVTAHIEGPGAGTYNIEAGSTIYPSFSTSGTVKIFFTAPNYMDSDLKSFYVAYTSGGGGGGTTY